MGTRFVALVSYQGTPYCGWQIQAGRSDRGVPSVQGTLQDALFKMTQETASVLGSGRTDAGVHASGQVCQFTLQEESWEAPQLIRGLNNLLPDTVQILQLQKAPPKFHVQWCAKKKQYSYYLQQGPCPLPYAKDTSWWIRKYLDIEAMQKSLNLLRGQHDFIPFRASGGSKTLTTVREILEAEVERVPAQFLPVAGDPISFIRIKIVGTGFLKQMVRAIVGTVVQVGEGKRDPESFREILSLKDRKQVGPTAPARGLWLERVWYDLLEWERFDNSGALH